MAETQTNEAPAAPKKAGNKAKCTIIHGVLKDGKVERVTFKKDEVVKGLSSATMAKLREEGKIG